MQEFEELKLKNQLCFPLYACAREVIKRYKPLLDELDLTYTQYITMLVLWEEGRLNVKTLGEKLNLDSGTLTPLLKKMEQKGLLTRERCRQDERSLIVALTPKGEALKEPATEIPRKMSQCVPLTPEESKQLYTLLYKILDK